MLLAAVVASISERIYGLCLNERYMPSSTCAAALIYVGGIVDYVRKNLD